MDSYSSHILHEPSVPYTLKNRVIPSIHSKAYTSLTNHLSKEGYNKTAQSYLIVGESGSGKTFLLKRLYASIRHDLGLPLHPILIEGKSLFSSADIWNQCASQLLMSEERDAFEAIQTWQGHHSKRIVLLIDNIQYYFQRTDNTDQFGLRGKLNRNGAPALAATTESVLPQFTRYDAAFFEGFRIYYLSPLNIEDVGELVKGYNLHRLERIMGFLPKTIRSLFIALEILKRSECSEDDLPLLSDFFFENYRQKYDNTCSPAQRILSTLSQAEECLSLSEIGAKTGLRNNIISPYLKLMTDQNLINREAKTARKGKYAIQDPLYKQWLRQNTTSQKGDTMDYAD